MKRARYRKRKRHKIYAVMFAFSIVLWVLLQWMLSRVFYAYGEKTDNSEKATDNMAESSQESLEYYDVKHSIDMKGISQEGIPTGCESVSTVAVLRYYGIDITTRQFIVNYLPMESFYEKNGRVYGANPSKAFAGDPYEWGSLGCYCEVIEKACVSMREDNYKGTSNLNVKTIKGSSLTELAHDYVQRDKPVIIWATSDMKESYDGFTYYLETGEKYVWKAMEHCVVLCGYDEESYYVMDPLKNGQIVKYDKFLVEQRYEEMGRQAVLIERAETQK